MSSIIAVTRNILVAISGGRLNDFAPRYNVNRNFLSDVSIEDTHKHEFAHVSKGAKRFLDPCREEPLVSAR